MEFIVKRYFDGLPNDFNDENDKDIGEYRGDEDLKHLEANDYDEAYPPERKELITNKGSDNNEVIKRGFITIAELRDRTHKLIIDFFKENPNPTDDMVHDFAEEMGLKPDGLENIIYKVLTKLVLNQPGKHNDVPDEEFDPEQLAMGIEIEKEHTDCPDTAKSIAKDHLSEISDYYDRLKQMEEEAGVED